MEEKLDYKLTYLTETIEDMKREMVRIRMILSNSRKTHYSNQEVIDLLEISSATLKKWRDQKLIGYSAVGNTYYYTDEDIESFIRNNHKKSVFETGMDD
jgi:hypothetical protein